MNRIDRLFSILILLQSRKYVNTEFIAEKFSLSVRTVYRDIKALNESGIPIGFEASKGYFIMPEYFLSPVAFTSEEANALILMESFVNGFADRSIQTHYSAALNKVRSVLRYHQKERLEALHETIKFQLPAALHNDFAHLADLQRAISSNIIVELEYRNQAGQISTRRAEPIGLIFYAFSWHLIAWCHLRHEYRDFKVARISKLHVLQQPFLKWDHMAIADYMKLLPVQY